MLQKTRGIVLHHFNYSEHSIIAHIYTEHFGRQSFMINGVYKRKAKMKANLFSPLNLLNMEMSYKEKRSIQRLKEVNRAVVLSELPFQPAKSSVALFLAEVLYRTLKEEEENPALFEFLFNAVQLFDIIGEGTANFHLIFLIQLSKFLGIFPESRQFSGTSSFFDLKEGEFCSIQPEHRYFLETTLSRKLYDMLPLQFSDAAKVELNQQWRSQLLHGLINYYRFHIEGMPEIQSLAILQQVFSTA